MTRGAAAPAIGASAAALERNTDMEEYVRKKETAENLLKAFPATYRGVNILAAKALWKVTSIYRPTARDREYVRRWKESMMKKKRQEYPVQVLKLTGNVKRSAGMRKKTENTEEKIGTVAETAAEAAETKPEAGSAAAIAAKCDELKAMLLEKNRRYGDSALNPRRVFSKSDPLEQLRVRMDDKLSRISNLAEVDGDSEDACMDLAGYLLLYLVARQRGA